MYIYSDLDKVEQLYKRASKLWEHGNNSGNAATLQRCHVESIRLHDNAELILSFNNITVTYPGLYPVYKYEGLEYSDIPSLKQSMHST